jgi:hypothetical protein
MNISQLGAAMALNMPMSVRSIKISSIVKPASDLLDRLLGSLLIDIWMHP